LEDAAVDDGERVPVDHRVAMNGPVDGVLDRHAELRAPRTLHIDLSLKACSVVRHHRLRQAEERAAALEEALDARHEERDVLRNLMRRARRAGFGDGRRPSRLRETVAGRWHLNTLEV